MSCKNVAEAISVFQAGPMQDWFENHVVKHPTRGKIPGKVFLKEPLNLTGAEISLGSIPPGEGVPFIHTHKQNEEVYIFLTGHGEMLLDGESHSIEPGTVFRVATRVERTWRNTGPVPLTYIVIQAKTDSLEQWTGEDGNITGEAPWA
ncbi:MAG: cupin domain-containing protein [Planctomycetaceae bacterium]|nr:cupin domain-containing protein [Planctomycetaceae bacterium]